MVDAPVDLVLGDALLQLRFGAVSALGLGAARGLLDGGLQLAPVPFLQVVLVLRLGRLVAVFVLRA